MKKIIAITLFLSIIAFKISAAEYEVAALPSMATIELISSDNQVFSIPLSAAMMQSDILKSLQNVSIASDFQESIHLRDFDSQTLLNFQLVMWLFDKYRDLKGLAQLQAIARDIVPMYRSADSAILMNLFALADLLQMKHLAELVSLVFIIKTHGMDTELQKKEAHQIYLSLLKKQAFLSAHTFIKYFNLLVSDQYWRRLDVQEDPERKRDFFPSFRDYMDFGRLALRPNVRGAGLRFDFRDHHLTSLDGLPEAVQKLGIPPDEIYALDFRNNYLKALDPAWFVGFTNVNRLNFANNRLTYVPPEFFDRFPRLQEINLSNNRFSDDTKEEIRVYLARRYVEVIF
jgi:Leucine-rich repeat (LRR) protein